MKEQTQNSINKQFSNIIREKMTGEQFWTWVTLWLDTEEICNQAEEWEITDKQNTINDFNENKFNLL